MMPHPMSEHPDVREGDVLWTPSAEARERSRLTAFGRWLESDTGRRFPDYAALWRWSVAEPGAFWEAVWRHFGVRSHAPYRAALESRAMPGALWFPGARLNYAEHALARRDEHPALVYRHENGQTHTLTYRELGDRVARVRQGLRRKGVGLGDRVAGVVPNTPETVVAFLATASLGATWSSCSPDFGVGSVLDRFRQIEPTVLFGATSYEYAGRRHDRREALCEVVAGLPSLRAAVAVPGGGAGERPPAGFEPWEAMLGEGGPHEFTPVPFDHPLWILYSSGTTGLPKPIVHGHGGILLEHLKALALHGDLGENDRFFWFTTTGWMMWNYLVSGLLLGSTVLLYDGSPGHPDLGALWRFAAESRMTFFGTSAPYLLALRKAGFSPRRVASLDHLRAIGSTGAPLPVEGFAYVYEEVKRDVLLASVSGGTDVCTAFLLQCPWLPVRAGEIQCAGLGCKVEAFDANGRPVVGEVGELVLTEPMPSMPVMFWNDPQGERYRESYFGAFPGAWRHGDWVKTTPHGSAVIYGRSDSTLNRGGVRMGTSEFYRVVEALPEVADSLVVDTGALGSEDTLWLFVVLREGVRLDAALCARIRATLREALSPRHVPDRIRAVPAIPRTLNGKKVEVPVKRILSGTPIERAVNFDTLADRSAIEPFLALARERDRG
jgi:acetoacetyl-CoA synthetase